jgi:hypothetical protein
MPWWASGSAQPADEADSGRTSLRLCRPSRLIRRPVSLKGQDPSYVRELGRTPKTHKSTC